MTVDRRPQTDDRGVTTEFRLSSVIGLQSSFLNRELFIVN